MATATKKQDHNWGLALWVTWMVFRHYWMWLILPAGVLVGIILGINQLNLQQSYFNKDFWDSLGKDEEKFNAAAEVMFLMMVGIAGVILSKAMLEEWLGRKIRSLLTERIIDLRAKLKGVQADGEAQIVTYEIEEYAKGAISFASIMVNSVLAAYIFGCNSRNAPEHLLFWALVIPLSYSLAMLLIGYKLPQREKDRRRANADMHHEYENFGSGDGSADKLRAAFRRANHATLMCSLHRAPVVACMTIFELTKGLMAFYILAPAFLRGTITVGDGFKYAIAFGCMVDAISVFIREFVTLINFVAVVARIGELWKTLEERAAACRQCSEGVVANSERVEALIEDEASMAIAASQMDSDGLILAPFTTQRIA